MRTSKFFWLRDVVWDLYLYTNNNEMHNEMHRARHDARLDVLNSKLELRIKEVEKEVNGELLSLQEVRRDIVRTFPIDPDKGSPFVYYSYGGCILFLGLFQK